MEMNHERHPRGENDVPWWKEERNRHPITKNTSQEDLSLFSNTPRKQLENYFSASLLALAILFITFLVSIFIASKPYLFNDVCQTPKCIHAAATLLDAMNMSANPCDDFYQFACGNWKADYPADMEDEVYSLQSWMTEQAIRQKKVLIGRLREANTREDPSGVRAARRVFKACQDMAAINTVGLSSMWALLNKLGLPRFPTNESRKDLPWTRSLGRVARYLGLDPIVGLSVTSSVYNCTINRIAIFSPEDSENSGIFGGWNMDVFLKNEKFVPSKNTVYKWDTYVSEIIRYLIEAGGGNVEDDTWLLSLARSIRKVFAVINEAVKTDVYPKYIVAATPTQMAVSEFQKIIDGSSSTKSSKLQLKPFLEEMLSDFLELNVDLSTDLIEVYRMQYYKTLSHLLEHVADNELELFIWWKVVHLLAAHTNQDLMYLKDKMLRYLSNGKHPTLSREAFCYYNVIQLMQPSLGYFIVQDIQKLKIHQVKSIADNIKKVFISTIRSQDWMDEKSRRASVRKVQSAIFSIGVPKWMENTTNFDELYRSRGENRPGVKDGQIPLYEFKHLENLQTLVDFAVKKMIKKLIVTNNRNEEDFDPTLINAFYSVDVNAVTIPYSILELPVLGWENEALNYGTIGAILSHELHHAFDTTGRMYDENGNLQSWWSDSTIQQHKKRVSCLEDQYSKFQVPYFNSSVKLDGNRTVHENMADNGGLKVAFGAYKFHMNQNPPELKMPGLQEYSREQLFFLAFARAKCSKYTKIGLSAVLQDVHSPDFVRVLVTLQNSPEFSTAWKCPKGSFMNPENRCFLWS